MRQLQPKRDPRPKTDDGTYLCYHEGCECEADVATPRRIEATEGPDPVENVVTFCLRHFLAWRVLKMTGQPLESALKIHEGVIEGESDESWVQVRLESRVLANLVLFDDPLGSDPPGEDSPLGNILDHAGDTGDRLRKRIEMPVEEQLATYGVTDDDTPAPGEASSLEDF